MSEQVPNENTLPIKPYADFELGQGLTGLSSAWPLYVGEPINTSDSQPNQGPEAAAG